MLEKISDFLKSLPSMLFFIFINPALVMGLGFLIITGSVRGEQIAKWTGIELFSLNGLLNYDSAFQISSIYHSFLNDYYLIPILFLAGIGVLIIKWHWKIDKTVSPKKRRNKAISLAIIESLFVSIILFGGVIGNIAALLPDAISNLVFFLGITIPVCGLIIFKEKLVKDLYNFLEYQTIR